MLPIPANILASFDDILKRREIPARLHIHYRKWLRYFLDFCFKYSPPETKSEQVKLFIAKLRSKKQSPELCKQAQNAKRGANASFLRKKRATPPMDGRREKRRPLCQPSLSLVGQEIFVKLLS